MRRISSIVFILLLIALFFTEFFHPITAINVDLGRHLLLGKIILSTHQVPHTNLLSYTYPDFPYINTSWLTDVIYYFLFSVGGFNLLLFVNTILIAFAFGLVVFITLKKTGLTCATFFAITLYLLLLGLRSDIRPEVMSMFCLSFFMAILLSSKGTDKRVLFLIPIELLWVNLHIYFFVGPLLVTLYLIDNLITNRNRMVKAKFYFIALAGTLIATFINPNGIKGALFPFTVLQNYGLPVIENQSIPTLFAIYHSSEIVLPVTAILLLLTVLFLARKNTKPIDWMLAIVFSLATFFIFRNILLFVFTTFLTFTQQLNFFASTYRPYVKKLPRVLNAFICGISLLLLLLFIVMSIATNGFGFGVRATGVGAVNFLIANNSKGPIYNNFDIGDYLAFRLYPEKVFVDNRPEAYPASFFQKVYLPMQNNLEIFKQTDNKYHFNTVVLSYWDNTPWGTNLLKYLVNTSNFRLVYIDPYTLVLVRNTNLQKHIIAKYLVTEKNFNIADENLPMSIHYLFFFEKVGWYKKEALMLSRYKKTDPQFCEVKQYPLEKTEILKYINKQKITTNCNLFKIS